MDSGIQRIDKTVRGEMLGEDKEPNETCFMRKMADIGKETWADRAECKHILARINDPRTIAATTEENQESKD